MIDKSLLTNRLEIVYCYLRDRGIVHTISEFAKTIGKPQPHVSSAFKGDPKRCTIGLMKSIADAFPDILNRDYLLKGEGSVAAPDKNLRPHFSAKASAGFMDGMSDAESSPEMRRISVPGLDYDFSIEARGNSMLPRIEDGDTLLCKRSADRLNSPVGRICVIDSKDGAAVKVITDADNESLTLHSLNHDYKDFKVDIADVFGIAEIVGLVRKF